MFEDDAAARGEKPDQVRSQAFKIGNGLAVRRIEKDQVKGLAAG